MVSRTIVVPLEAAFTAVTLPVAPKVLGLPKP